MWTVLLLALSLAVDAAAVSASLGAAGVRWTRLALAAGLFGGFQAGMAALGALGGLGLEALGGPWPAWIGAALLAWLGARMVVAPPDGSEPRDVSLYALVVLAVATSVDALAAGLTLPTLDAPLAVAIAAIGLTAGVLSVVAAWSGRWLGARIGPTAERVAGLVLIGLAVRIAAGAAALRP